MRERRPDPHHAVADGLDDFESLLKNQTSLNQRCLIEHMHGVRKLDGRAPGLRLLLNGLLNGLLGVADQLLCGGRGRSGLVQQHAGCLMAGAIK